MTFLKETAVVLSIAALFEILVIAGFIVSLLIVTGG